MLKIAVCDDDRLLTGEIDSQLQKIREKTGISFETDIFFDGETLWKAIEQNGSYDVVYLDIEMKNMDGITVARKMTAITNSCLKSNHCASSTNR